MHITTNNKSTKMRFEIASAVLCASFLLGAGANSKTAKADTINSGEQQAQQNNVTVNNTSDIPVEVVTKDDSESTKPTTSSTPKVAATNSNITDKNSNQATDSRTVEDPATPDPTQSVVANNRSGKAKKTGLKGKSSANTSDSTWDNVQADYDTTNHSLTIKGGNLFNPNPIYKQFANSQTDLQSIKITGKVNVSGNIKTLFAYLSNLTSIDGLDNLNVDNVTDMSYLFDGDKSLTKVDLSGWRPTKTTSMYQMFNNCTSLEKVYVDDTKDASGNWFNTEKVTNMSSMFKNNKKLVYLGSKGADTNVGKKEINFNLATDSVTDMSEMFQGCDSIESFKVGASNFKSVNNMGSMFADCLNLEQVTGTFNTHNLSDLSYMFANDPKLTSAILEGMEVGIVDRHPITTSRMFYNDAALKHFSLSGLHDLVDTSYMFANASSLNEDLNKFMNELGKSSSGQATDTQISKLTNMMHMLDGCTGLTNLDLTYFNTNDAIKANKDGMFRGLTGLKQITLGKNVNLEGTDFMPPFDYTAVGTGSVEVPNGKKYTATQLRKFWNNQSDSETFVGTPTKYYNVTINYVDTKTKKVLKSTTKLGNDKDPIEFSKEFKATIAALTEGGAYTYDAKNNSVPLDKNGDIQLPNNINSDVTYEVGLAPKDTASDTVVTNVIVHYHDEFGNKLLPDETITGKLGSSWNAVPKTIKGYHLVRTDGMATGTISDVRQEVTFVYAKDEDSSSSGTTKPNKPNKPDTIDHGSVIKPVSSGGHSLPITHPTIIKAAQASEIGNNSNSGNLPQTGVNVKKNTNAFFAGIVTLLASITGLFGFARKKEEDSK